MVVFWSIIISIVSFAIAYTLHELLSWYSKTRTSGRAIRIQQNGNIVKGDLVSGNLVVANISGNGNMVAGGDIVLGKKACPKGKCKSCGASVWKRDRKSGTWSCRYCGSVQQ